MRPSAFPWTTAGMQLLSGSTRIATVGFSANSPLWPSWEQAEANLRFLHRAPDLLMAAERAIDTAAETDDGVLITTEAFVALVQAARLAAEA